jgi:uncharacterized protein YndB with AHSA1/START domain
MTAEHSDAIRAPDLSNRPYFLTLDRHFAVDPSALYQAWTTGFDRWFAAPGSMLLQPEVNKAFFFETEFRPEGESAAQRHPHYGRFIRLVADRLVELTWVTGAGGTEGAETVVTVQLEPMGEATHLKLTHSGFAGEAARDRHHHAWPFLLDRLDERLET